MSKSISEPIAPIVSPESPPQKHARRWPGWAKWIVIGLVFLWLADAGISLLIRHSTLRRSLTARLEAAFGRPVDVRSYSFSLWAGPELQAYAVRVGEDPRFGNEYFLRAESVTVRVRLSSLLLGRFELGTISLSHPSLNLVRDAGGDWNLAEWLPLPERTPSTGTRMAAPRFRKIEVSGGRINFKRGDDKLPFAFVDVAGTLETEAPGRWRLDLVAVPERAAVIVEDPGVLHLVGHVGGTSSRLRPAALEIDWSGASIPDVLRLAADRDYGVRGTAGLSVTARTQGDAWMVGGNALFSQLHRWDLPLRDDNPAVSVVAHGRLDPSGSRLELKDARIEMAHSNASLTGALDWAHAGTAGKSGAGARTKAQAKRERTKSLIATSSGADTELHLASSSIALSDLLEWARAFHPGIADEVALGGFADLDSNLGGWPPRVEAATFQLPRGVMIGTGTPSVRLGSFAIRYDADRGIALAPATVVVGAPANMFRVEGSAKAVSGKFSLNVSGATTNVRDVVAVANSLGWNLARGWNLAGPARCDLHWQGAADTEENAEENTLTGSVEWGTATEGVSLSAAFLNRPIEGIRGRVDLKPGLTRVGLSSARAFGATWTGSFEHQLADGWKFSVSGDSLSAAELDRWFDPRWRESFLDRMLPFLNARASAGSALAGLRASGKILLDEFTLAPVTVHRLRGDLIVDGRRVELTNAAGQFNGGQVTGDLRANFDPTPKYETAMDFSGVDLRMLAADFPSLAGRFAGSASAKVRLNLHGASRSDLLNSLECRGTSVATGLTVKNITLPNSDQTATSREIGDPAPSLFSRASTSFSCAARKIQFQDLMLSTASGQLNGAGAVDFGRNLDLRLRAASADPAEARPAKLTAADKRGPGGDATTTEYRITGTLGSPRIVREALAHSRVARR